MAWLGVRVLIYASRVIHDLLRPGAKSADVDLEVLEFVSSHEQAKRAIRGLSALRQP